MSTEIRAKRKKLGLSQNTFWGRIGVTQSGGSRFESGRRIPVTVLILLDLVYGPYAEARKVLTDLRRLS